jgi:uncharacterized membrane protein
LKEENPRRARYVKAGMTDKRSKYDTDPLDPDFVRRAEENLWGASRAPRAGQTDPIAPPSVTEEQTRRFDEQTPDSYPSVFVPPAYQPPRPQPQPFTTFGAGPHQPPATTVPPPGPASPYPGPHAQPGGPASRTVTRLGIPENIALALPYVPFHIGLVAALVELALVPRQERRVRFHAAQGLALQLAIVALTVLFKFVTFASGNRFGAALFGAAATIFLVVSIVRVLQGKPHHIAPLEEPARWLNEKIAPTQ